MGIPFLPTELFQLIAQDLSKSDIHALSKVSRDLRKQCEPLIFKSIKLRDNDESRRIISERLLKRLCDCKDNMVYSVRHIAIGFVSPEARLPEQSLVLALRNMRALESLTWRTWLPITPSILACLHEVHPSARLCVVAVKRNDLPLDELLLSSPQLHALDVKLSVLWDKNDENVEETKGKSEARQLKSLLMRSTSLRVLKMEFESIRHGSGAAYNRFQHYGPSEVEPVLFHFNDGEMLPTLEALVLRQYYQQDDGNGMTEFAKAVEACKAWRVHQDWSSLKVLDVRIDNCESILQGLTGAVPQLHTLKICGHFDHHREILRDFLSNVPRLRNLRCEDSWLGEGGFTEAVRSSSLVQLTSFFVETSCLDNCCQPDFESLLASLPRLQEMTVKGPGTNLYGDWTADEARTLPLKDKIRSIGWSANKRSRR